MSRESLTYALDQFEQHPSGHWTLTGDAGEVVAALQAALSPAPPASGDRYQLTVSGEQLSMISIGTEITARACIGQFGGIAFQLFMGLPVDQFCEIRDALDAVQEKVTGSPTLSAAPNARLRDDHELAWSIYHAARYRVFRDQCAKRGEDPSKTWTVLNDPPERCGRHDPPEIVRLGTEE